MSTGERKVYIIELQKVRITYMNKNNGILKNIKITYNLKKNQLIEHNFVAYHSFSIGRLS